MNPVRLLFSMVMGPINDRTSYAQVIEAHAIVKDKT